MRKVIAAMTAGLFLCLGATAGSAADKPAPTKVERIDDKPDTTAGETRKSKVLVNGEVVSITTEYNDGRIKLQEFRRGQLIGEAEMLKGGGLKNSRFKDGKPFEIITVRGGTIESQDFRPDGKLWSTSFYDKTGTCTYQYFGKDGVLRLTREIKKSGSMEVRVLDPKGKQLYKQTWVPGIAGYVLQTVEESTATGTRRITVSGGKAVKAEYLSQDGTVSKTEDGDKLSEAFDTTRTSELDPKDDKTIPRSAR